MARAKKKADTNNFSDFIEALNDLEKERNISKDALLDAIEKSLKAACKKDFDADENSIDVNIDRETGEYHVYTLKTVVENVEKMGTEISLEQAKMIDVNYELGDIVRKEIITKDFGRIAAQRARNVIIQAINESERDSIYDYFSAKEGDIVTGVVQRYVGDNGNNVSVKLNERTEALLKEKDIIPGETFKPGESILLYVSRVEKSTRGPRIIVSRTDENFVKKLFEREVTEIADGTVVIKGICREAGSRTKMAVYSKDENVDAVGACVGMNSERVNRVVANLLDEKIDIISWDENPFQYIINALSPSDVNEVEIDFDTNKAFVIVPDDQLSLAIGKKGQNARLATKLTRYAIDIKSQTDAENMGYYDEEPEEYEEYEEYEEDAQYGNGNEEE